MSIEKIGMVERSATRQPSRFFIDMRRELKRSGLPAESGKPYPTFGGDAQAASAS